MNFHHATPILSVRDLEASREYYVHRLGFKVDFYEKGIICSVSRGECTLFLSQTGQGHPGTWVWIGVGDAAALHEELKAKGVQIRVPPTNYPWALEVHVEDPDGHVLRFGSEPDDGSPMGEWLAQDGMRWAPLPGGRWKRAEELTDGDRASQRAHAAMRKGDAPTAQRALHEAMEWWSKAGDVVNTVAALRDLAELERHLKNLEGSRAYYEAAILLIRAKPEPERLAYLLRHLGDVQHQLGRLAEADAAYAEALSLYRGLEKPNVLDIANTLRRQAIVARDQGDAAAALRLWREAHELYVRFGHPSGIAESAAWVAELAQEAGDLMRAREYLAKAEQAAEHCGEESKEHVRMVREKVG